MTYSVQFIKVKDGQQDIYINGRFAGWLSQDSHSPTWLFESCGQGRQSIFSHYREARARLGLPEMHHAVQHDWDLLDGLHNPEICQHCRSKRAAELAAN